MTRKALAEALRALKLYNDAGLLATFGKPGEDVGVTYSAAETGRMGSTAETQVRSPSHKTQVDGPWYNDGCKTFLGKRSESMPKALAWAEGRYGITEWAGSPFFPPASHRIPAYVLTAALAAAKRGAL